MQNLNNLKNLDFNKNEYDFFLNNCCFTDRQIDIINLKRKGKSIVQISLELFISESTVKRELSKIRYKILKLI